VHVFPQIVDGAQPDGSKYYSLIYVTNTSGSSSSCSLSLYGLSPSRLVSVGGELASGAWAGFLTSGEGALAQGYARLDCSQPVSAALIYQLVSKDGLTTLGMATVFSSPAVNYAMYPVFMTPGSRTGIALANDNDVPANFTIQFTDATRAVT